MRILAIDDKIESFREALADALPEYELRCAPNGEEALFYLKQDPGVDLVLLDIKMPPTVGEVEEREGIEVLRSIREQWPTLPVIMLSVFQEIDLVIEAIQLGAFYYLVKPLDVEKLRAAVARAIDQARQREENQALRGAIAARDELLATRPENETDRLGSLVGASEPMRRLYSMIRCVAATPHPVLVTGTTGSGKELIAREVHALSDRVRGPFVAVNTAAIPAELLESEMFGHVKGAFTGAVQDKAGRFEEADGGTIFLDEIGDMSPSLQAKLLRVLQDHRIQRIGSGQVRECDFRLVCATHRDLRAMIGEGSFREDLYYRINVLPLIAPSLQERGSDIERLAIYFAERSGKGQPPSISPEALKILLSHTWPGNVRELENVITRACVLAGRGPVRSEHIMLDTASVPFAGAVASDPASPFTDLIEQVRSGQLRVEDLGQFKKQFGEAGLEGVIFWALRETLGNYGKAMVLVGYADDEKDTRKNAAFRQTVKRLGLSRTNR